MVLLSVANLELCNGVNIGSEMRRAVIDCLVTVCLTIIDERLLLEKAGVMSADAR
jgi:hypothetical protein